MSVAKPRRGRPGPDPGTIARALEMVDAGATPAEVASDLGVAQSTVYGWLAARRRRPAPKAPPRPPRTPRRDPAVQDDASELDELEDVDVAGVHAAPDDVAAIDALIALVETKLKLASEARVGALAATLAGLIVKRARLRPTPPKSAEEIEREARPLADEVLENIEKAVRAAEQELALP